MHISADISPRGLQRCLVRQTEAGPGGCVAYGVVPAAGACCIVVADECEAAEGEGHPGGVCRTLPLCRLHR